MDRKEIKKRAKEFAFSNKWNFWKVLLLFSICTGILFFIFELLGTTQTCGPYYNVELCTYTTYGYITSFIYEILSAILGVVFTIYVLELVRTKSVPDLKKCFNFLKKSWKTLLLATILYIVIVTIGTLLLIIPGIIASIGLTFYIIVIYDNPELSARDALRKSWDLINGHKMEYFVFGLSFILWGLLCAFIVPIIWVMPYMYIANIMFYEKLVELKK